MYSAIMTASTSCEVNEEHHVDINSTQHITVKVLTPEAIAESDSILSQTPITWISAVDTADVNFQSRLGDIFPDESSASSKLTPDLGFDLSSKASPSTEPGTRNSSKAEGDVKTSCAADDIKGPGIVPDAVTSEDLQASTKRPIDGNCDNTNQDDDAPVSIADFLSSWRDRKRARRDSDGSDMGELKNSCNEYERALLPRIAKIKDINVTFDDVHVHRSTKDALRDLTLSLRQPKSFSYGVLKDHSVPGVLLYGAPGTGKTLLVKALAKESGATVLPIASADILEMYVGEGEKKIRAIFTLARKFLPCIVFIDEGDSLFRCRSTETRTSQRAEINQFLQEWEGFSSNGNKGAILVVATNRPYDLDEAALRRLSRRILVDVPEVPDREAILRIVLKDESLASDVDLLELARKTPFYTGSDLKNLAVAAALSCVREQPDEAGEDTAATAMTTRDAPCSETAEDGQEKRRILQRVHFERAREEIRSTISPDSLSKIREFHTKFGNTAKKDN